MENTIELVKSRFSKFMKKELLSPLVDKYFDIHETGLTYFKRLSEPLAALLDEYYPDYYSSDYKAHIGCFYYASLWGDSVSEEELLNELKKYIDDETDTRIHQSGLHILFSDSLDSIKFTLDRESVRELRLYFEDISDVIHLIIIEMLNSGELELLE